MSDLKAKMHQNRFPLGLRPRPLAGLRGLLLKARKGKKEERGKGRERSPRFALVWGLNGYNPALVNSTINVFKYIKKHITLLT